MKQNHACQYFDLSEGEYIYYHHDSDQGAYVQDSLGNYGYVPINIIAEEMYQQTSEDDYLNVNHTDTAPSWSMNASFDSLKINQDNLTDTSDDEAIAFVRPAPVDSSIDDNGANDSCPRSPNENLPQPEIDSFPRRENQLPAKRRLNDELSSQVDETKKNVHPRYHQSMESTTEKIVRVTKTSRKGSKTNTLVLITSQADRYYRLNLKDVSKFGQITFTCADCKGGALVCTDIENIESYPVGKRLKRRLIDAKMTKEQFTITNSKSHTCMGRKGENFDFIEDMIVKVSQAYTDGCSMPTRLSVDDLMEIGLKDAMTHLKQTKAAVEEFKLLGSRVRNLKDRLRRILQKARSEKEGEPLTTVDFDIYSSTEFQIDSELRQSTGPLLFYQKESLKYLSDEKAIILIDGTFAHISSQYYQILKIRILKKDTSALVCYALMESKTLEEYRLIFDRLKILVGTEMKGYMVTTDQEASLRKIAREYFAPTTIIKICSFHYIQLWKKNFISKRLKTFINFKARNSSNPTHLLIYEIWVVVRMVPYVPSSIMGQLISYLERQASKIDGTLGISVSSLLNNIRNDVDLKPDINWWNEIRYTETFVDTTQARIERSNLSLKKYIIKHCRNNTPASRLFTLNAWANNEYRKSCLLDGSSRKQTKAVLAKREEIKNLGELLESFSGRKLRLADLRKIFHRIVRVMADLS